MADETQRAITRTDRHMADYVRVSLRMAHSSILETLRSAIDEILQERRELERAARPAPLQQDTGGTYRFDLDFGFGEAVFYTPLCCNQAAVERFRDLAGKCPEITETIADVLVTDAAKAPMPPPWGALAEVHELLLVRRGRTLQALAFDEDGGRIINYHGQAEG